MPEQATVTWRAALQALAIGVSSAMPFARSAVAQASQKPLLQVEVADSIGLPLPDAKVEVFTFLAGGVFWEWVPVSEGGLEEGINLLRFSNPGYESATFSVPLRDGGTLSLRVRLQAEHDTTKDRGVTAREVHAIGLALDGRFKTDVIGRRRIIERRAIEREPTNTFGTLLHRARGTELKMLPASGGTFRPYAQSGAGNCSMSVMVNGDRRRILPFETFDRLFSAADAEAIEVFPRAGSLPAPYQTPDTRCGVMVVWFKSL